MDVSAVNLISGFVADDIDFLLENNEQKPIEPPPSWISEYISKIRIMPPNSPMPGYYDPGYTPYMIEIMDNMSPASPIKHSAVMKGVQIGATTGCLENTVAFYIENPADIMFISATDENLKKWSIKKLDPLIDSCGFRERGLIYGQTENVKSRRSGDTALMKEFVGGTLLMTSARSPSGMRQDSVRILLRDEIDGAPTMLITGEGNWLEVSEARTFAFGNRAKIVDVSTPTTYEESNVYQQYLIGDQRKFYVPCPHCNEYQVIEWGNDDTVWGIKQVKIDGNEVVVYVCKKCNKRIFNTDKNYMLPRGEWRPTATPRNKYFRSYHLPALYSPVGMMSWQKAYDKYLAALDDPIDGLRSFTNLILGLPYKEEGSRPKLNKVIANKGGYKSGDIPDGVLFLTAGLDVQLGSKQNKANPPRIELEILGHGAGYRTWSISYIVFEGSVSDPYDGAYQQLYDFWESGGFVFEQNGITYPIQRLFIDCGADMHTQNVMRFCARGIPNIYPTKGFKFLSKRRDEHIDEITSSDSRRYRWARSGESGYYQIATVFYKRIIYSNLEIERRSIDPQRPGFCSFPQDYKDKYFRMLTAEDMIDRGRGFHSGGRRNEALDCRVNALCASHVFLDDLLAVMRNEYIRNGGTKESSKMITIKNVIEELELAHSIAKTKK